MATIQILKVKGYHCPACCEIHDGHPKTRTGWQVVGDLITDDEDVTLERPRECTVHECGEGEYFKDAPEYVDGWQCGDCETLYETADEAADCCS